MQMTPEDSLAARKVVAGCTKIMFSKSSFQFLKQGLEAKKPMPDKLAEEAVGLLKLFSSRVTGAPIPRQVLLPAIATLILVLAKFVEDAKLADPTPADVKAAIAKAKTLLLQEFPAPGSAPAAAPAAAPVDTPVGVQ